MTDDQAGPRPAGGGIVTRSRVEEIRALLDAAGDEWRQVADALPEVIGTHAADHRYRDRVELGEHVQHSADQPTWTYPSTLYRSGGRWWATGWSDASKARIHQPSGVFYDPDAGVHRLIEDAATDDEPSWQKP